MPQAQGNRGPWPCGKEKKKTIRLRQYNIQSPQQSASASGSGSIRGYLNKGKATKKQTAADPNTTRAVNCCQLLPSTRRPKPPQSALKPLHPWTRIALWFGYQGHISRDSILCWQLEWKVCRRMKWNWGRYLFPYVQMKHTSKRKETHRKQPKRSKPQRNKKTAKLFKPSKKRMRMSLKYHVGLAPKPKKNDVALCAVT